MIGGLVINHNANVGQARDNRLAQATEHAIQFRGLLGCNPVRGGHRQCKGKWTHASSNKAGRGRGGVTEHDGHAQWRREGTTHKWAEGRKTANKE